MSILDPLIEKYSKDPRVQNALIARLGQVGDELTPEESTRRILGQLLGNPEYKVQWEVEEHEKTLIKENAESQKELAIKTALEEYEATKKPLEAVVVDEIVDPK